MPDQGEGVWCIFWKMVSLREKSGVLKSTEMLAWLFMNVGRIERRKLSALTEMDRAYVTALHERWANDDKLLKGR